LLNGALLLGDRGLEIDIFPANLVEALMARAVGSVASRPFPSDRKWLFVNTSENRLYLYSVKNVQSSRCRFELPQRFDLHFPLL
jgi:hypothetical protein